MPFKNPKKRRAYQRDWIAKKRAKNAALKAQGELYDRIEDINPEDNLRSFGADE